MSKKGKSVLIVEDDALISEALVDGISQAGYNVTTAEDGEEGLHKALSDRPDLIVLDLMMPKKTGQEMLAELRQDKWGADVPVTVLTNASDSLDIFLTTKEGNVHYALKSSMKLEDIIKTVDTQLKKSR
jgi:two-component system alkaline phosphatase synthesis response regulator PhoP